MTTKLQDQDRSGQDQDHFFKIKNDFLKTIKLITQDLKKRFLTEKIKPVSRFCPIMPVTEKNLFITDFLVKFCFIQN